MSSRPKRLFFNRLAEIQRRLAQLDGAAAVAFAAACSERLLPTYESFSREARWGRPEFLRRALDAVWDGVEQGDLGRVPSAPTENEEEQDDGITPCVFAPDVAQTDDAPGALSACCAVYATLDAAHVTRPAAACALEASQQALEVLDWLIYERPLLPDLPKNDGGRSDRRVDEHPLMLREYERRLADLELVSAAGAREAARLLRRRWTGADVSGDQGPAA